MHETQVSSAIEKFLSLDPQRQKPLLQKAVQEEQKDFADAIHEVLSHLQIHNDKEERQQAVDSLIEIIKRSDDNYAQIDEIFRNMDEVKDPEVKKLIFCIKKNSEKIITCLQ